MQKKEKREDSIMDIRLIALDLDGTLCNSQRQVTERSMAALKAAAEQGVHIVPTTGRLFHAMPQELLRCGFVRYGICMNGGQIYDAAEDRILHRDEIPLDTAMRVYDYLEQFPVAYDCYVNNGAMMERAFWERLGEYIVGKPLDLAYSTKLRTPVEGFRARLLEMGVPLQKIQAFMSDVSIRPRMLRELQEGFPELSVSFSLAYNIEINSATATKGNALKKLWAFPPRRLPPSVTEPTISPCCRRRDTALPWETRSRRSKPPPIMRPPPMTTTALPCSLKNTC